MERLYESRKRDLEERLRHREEEDAGALRSIDQKVLAIEERIKGYGGDASTKVRVNSPSSLPDHIYVDDEGYLSR